MSGLDLKVSSEVWQRAQQWERLHWAATQKRRSAFGKNLAWTVLSILGLKPRYRGEDWNTWWLERFHNYSFLPARVMNAIELGCGPYTNMRFIQEVCRAQHLFLSDPLMETYVGFRQTFVADVFRRHLAYVDDHPIEECPFASGYFDLTVMINVLDHARDAEVCVKTAAEITRKGGILIIGQDLTNHEDAIRLRGTVGEIGHPLRLNHGWLDRLLLPRFALIQREVLRRDEGRAPEYHYGTYLFAGRKKR